MPANEKQEVAFFQNPFAFKVFERHLIEFECKADGLALPGFQGNSPEADKLLPWANQTCHHIFAVKLNYLFAINVTHVLDRDACF